jgi:hypothetical protein
MELTIAPMEAARADFAGLVNGIDLRSRSCLRTTKSPP